MPNKRIDQLNQRLNPLTGDELIPIFNVNGGDTEKITINEIVTFVDTISNSILTGGTFNNNVLTLNGNYGSITITGFTDYHTTGITINNTTLEFNRNDISNAYSVNLLPILSGFSATDYYTTGVTLNGTTLEFNRNDISNAYSVNLSSLKFTGNTSGDCITDIFVTNINSCSPLHIQPNNNGDVYLVENGGKVGIGTTTPNNSLDVFGDLSVSNSISATTYYGDGSNLINLPDGETFTGGTVIGETNFINGITANTVHSNSFIGDGSQLAGVVGLSYSDLGFTVTSPPPATINQNVVLPYNSTVTYPTPLIVGGGFTVTVPSGTTLTII